VGFLHEQVGQVTVETRSGRTPDSASFIVYSHSSASESAEFPKDERWNLIAAVDTAHEGLLREIVDYYEARGLHAPPPVKRLARSLP